MKEYIVAKDAWIYGSKYKAGDSIFLNEKQAKYELLSGTIEEKVVAPETKNAKPSRKNDEEVSE